jgi:hypothetical protein
MDQKFKARNIMVQILIDSALTKVVKLNCASNVNRNDFDKIIHIRTFLRKPPKRLRKPF